MLTQPDGHKGVHLKDDSYERLATWIDVYAQKLGSFSEEQEKQLIALRHSIHSLLIQ
jgi:hypothetical protein